MLEQRNGRQPTPEELAEELDLDPDKVRWMFKVSWQPMSLEQPAGDDGETELGAFIEDATLPQPGEAAPENLLQTKVEEVLATLSPREACILRMRLDCQMVRRILSSRSVVNLVSRVSVSGRLKGERYGACGIRVGHVCCGNTRIDVICVTQLRYFGQSN